jgi:hypothetical protein
MCCQAAGDTVTAIDRLEKLLAEAKTYLQDRNDMAAWGTLLCFDEASEDLSIFSSAGRVLPFLQYGLVQSAQRVFNASATRQPSLSAMAWLPDHTAYSAAQFTATVDGGTELAK